MHCVSQIKGVFVWPYDTDKRKCDSGLMKLLEKSHGDLAEPLAGL